MKMNLDDEIQASFLLSSLPESWETLVVTVSNPAPNEKLTIDLVKESLLNEDARRKEMGESSSRVLMTEKKRKEKGRSQSKNPRGNFKRDSSSGRSKSRPRRNITCFHCNKPGHIKRECRIWKREHDEADKKEKETNVVTNDGDTVVVYDDDCVNLVCQDSD